MKKLEVSSELLNIVIKKEEKGWNRTFIEAYKVPRGIQVLCSVPNGIIRIKPENGITVLENEIAIGNSNYFPNIVGFTDEVCQIDWVEIFNGLCTLRDLIDEANERKGLY